MNQIPYNDIPVVPGPRWERHGIFRNPRAYTLEVWILGNFYGDCSAELYLRYADKRHALQVIADDMLRPLWVGTPWQRVLVKQLFMPWVGDGRWWTNETP